jgi:phage N-6-adenine-methyltransferase
MAKAGFVFSKKDDYYTPSAIVERFGKFDYDPATTDEKAAEFGIPNYDTIETDGLKTDWTKFRRIWINPPFTIKHEFMKKAVETFMESKADIYILFPIEFITTKRFHDILGSCGGIIYVPDGRIKFESGLGKKASSPAFGSCVMKLVDMPTIIMERIKLEGGKE